MSYDEARVPVLLKVLEMGGRRPPSSFEGNVRWRVLVRVVSALPSAPLLLTWGEHHERAPPATLHHPNNAPLLHPRWRGGAGARKTHPDGLLDGDGGPRLLDVADVVVLTHRRDVRAQLASLRRRGWLPSASPRATARSADGGGTDDGGSEEQRSVAAGAAACRALLLGQTLLYERAREKDSRVGYKRSLLPLDASEERGPHRTIAIDVACEETRAAAASPHVARDLLKRLAIAVGVAPPSEPEALLILGQFAALRGVSLDGAPHHPTTLMHQDLRRHVDAHRDGYSGVDSGRDGDGSQDDRGDSAWADAVLARDSLCRTWCDICRGQPNCLVDVAEDIARIQDTSSRNVRANDSEADVRAAYVMEHEIPRQSGE